MEHQDTQGSTVFSIIGAICSIGSFVHANATQSNISWLVGVGAGTFAMLAAIMSIYTHFLKQQELRQRNREWRKANGGGLGSKKLNRNFLTLVIVAIAIAVIVSLLIISTSN